MTTSAAALITTTGATLRGNLMNEGNTPVTERGIVYSTSENPITSNSKQQVGSGTGIFSTTITGLPANTKYYVRAYAINSHGTAYGSQVAFTTLREGATGTVIDINGNTYQTVIIGTQTWMADNLKTTKYRDGVAIPNVAENTAWAGLTSGAYCWYNNDTVNKNKYGAMYNWFAVNTGKLCPTGWHVPGDSEWTTLSTFLGGINVAGGKMKETGTLHWSGINLGATNESWFSGHLPAFHCIDLKNSQ